jgi:hypothetical protein
MKLAVLPVKSSLNFASPKSFLSVRKLVDNLSQYGTMNFRKFGSRGASNFRDRSSRTFTFQVELCNESD